MACDISEPCKIPSLDSWKKRFLWTHKEVDLAPHPVVGLVLKEGDAVKFLRTLSANRRLYKDLSSMEMVVVIECFLHALL